MDVQYNEVELLRRRPLPFATALFVQSMVLSNNHRGSATVDAGFKSFAMDGPVPLVHAGAPAGAAFRFYGDEFGLLTWPAQSTRLPLATKVEFITPHCDPTVNLHNFYHCVRGDRLVDIWPVDARGPESNAAQRSPSSNVKDFVRVDEGGGFHPASAAVAWQPSRKPTPSILKE